LERAGPRETIRRSIPIVKTGGEKPTNAGDLGDESSASSEPLSLSADDDLPSGDESQETKSGSRTSTATETSEDEDTDPSYAEATPLANISEDEVEAPSYPVATPLAIISENEVKDHSNLEATTLANIILQSQTTVPTVVQVDPPPRPVDPRRKR
jgi:hypothetical protein